MLKYYIKNTQETRILDTYLLNNDYIYDPPTDYSIPDTEPLHVIVFPSTKKFQYRKHGTVGEYQYIQCVNLTELVERLEYRYLGKWGKIYSQYGPDALSAAILDSRRILLGKF